MAKNTGLTLDHLRSSKKPVTRSLRLATDQEVAERFHTAKNIEALAELELKAKPHSEAAKDAHAEAKAALDALTEELEANSIYFRFQAIGRKKFAALEKAHPITDEQRAQATKENDGKDPGIEWNPDTYPQALIAKSLVVPEISEDEMLEWIQDDSWNEAEIQAMFQAAYEANSMRAVVDLGKG